MWLEECACFDEIAQHHKSLKEKIWWRVYGSREEGCAHEVLLFRLHRQAEIVTLPIWKHNQCNLNSYYDSYDLVFPSNCALSMLFIWSKLLKHGQKRRNSTLQRKKDVVYTYGP